MIGGDYRPLSDHDLRRIHEAALDVLAMAEPIPCMQALVLSRGCHLNEQGRLCFPASFVEDIVAGAAHNFVLHGCDPKHDLEIAGNRVHYGTGGAAVKVLDSKTDAYSRVQRYPGHNNSGRAARKTAQDRGGTCSR